MNKGKNKQTKVRTMVLLLSPYRTLQIYGISELVFYIHIILTFEKLPLYALCCSSRSRTLHMVSLTVVDDEAGFVHGHCVPIDPDLPPPGLLRGELDVDQLPFLKQVHSCGFPVKLPGSGTELICYWSKSL